MPNVDATVTFSVAGVVVARQTVQLAVPPPEAKLTDDELNNYVRQAALKVLPSLHAADPTALRAAIVALR